MLASFFEGQLWCIDDSEPQIDLTGQIGDSQGKNFVLVVSRCQGRDTCRNETEIDDFLDNHVLMTMINTQAYIPEKYAEEAILDYVDVRFTLFDWRGRPYFRKLNLEQRTVESAETIVDLGFSQPNDHVFYTLVDAEEP